MTDTEQVFVVVEDGVGHKSIVRRVFDNRDAAEQYIDDPVNAGHLFVEAHRLESEYNNT